MRKESWSGRVDSNHRPPGLEPWEGRFCIHLQAFANYLTLYPCSFLHFLNHFQSFGLYQIVAACCLSLHEKGKKKAKSAKSLIGTNSLDASLGTRPACAAPLNADHLVETRSWAILENLVLSEPVPSAPFGPEFRTCGPCRLARRRSGLY